MENMVYFATDKNGYLWFICRDCGNKEHSQFKFCPVCQNAHRNPDGEFKAALENLISTRRIRT